MFDGNLKNGIVALLLMLAAVGVLSCGGEGETLESIPPELTGIWENSEKKYKGCQLEISASYLRFHGLEGALNEYFILSVVKVEAESGGGIDLEPGVKPPPGTHYIVSCRDTHDEQWDFHLIHTAGRKETLKFKNRSGKWHKN